VFVQVVFFLKKSCGVTQLTGEITGGISRSDDPVPNIPEVWSRLEGVDLNPLFF
jgi:hypothetical protein